MQTYLLERAQTIPLSRRETFAFFSDAFNLERLTPAYLKFRILTPPPIAMAPGTLIEYQLSLSGFPFRWRTLIEAWEPERLFIDRQINGPYQFWHHTHVFEALGPQQTLMRDIVRYRVEWGLIGALAHGLLVGRAVEEIFDYRARVITELLQPGWQSNQSEIKRAAA
jgi:ligand-binding SRPBCC domain-containing protein